ncbi:MAG: NAD(P)-dependent oxidoreductase [Planctomycetes bacterium]|nr:NAD(P)-dependent oxidoreductase [Planctomycetota bacterium]
MHIALTGASGFIGSVITRHAFNAGHTVSALVRNTSKRNHIEKYVQNFVVGTHDDDEAIDCLLQDADIVIHNSFDWSACKSGDLDQHLKTNLHGSIKLLEKSRDRHFIYMSSISVHHHMHPNWNGQIDESHPTRPGSNYGACKAAVEAHMWGANASHGQLVTALRPTAVYGIDPNIERTFGYPMIQSLKEGKPYNKLGGGKFVNVEDVAAATIACIGNPKSSPRVYNLVNCYARWADWATFAAKALGIDINIDTSSPPAPINTFETEYVTEDLGVKLNRGIQDIEKAVKELLNVM